MWSLLLLIGEAPRSPDGTVTQPLFRTTLIPGGDHESARKHGVPDDDIVHAYEHALTWVEVGEDPVRYLMAGPDRAGNLLELLLLATPTVDLVITR